MFFIGLAFSVLLERALDPLVRGEPDQRDYDVQAAGNPLVKVRGGDRDQVEDD
jgi:hypothetical protein